MRNRWLMWMALCLAVAVFLLAYPVYVIRPFRYQGSSELSAALWTLRYRLWFEVVCGVVAVIACLNAWRSATRLRKLGLALFTMLVLACGLLCRVNIYEQMFHPIGQPAFSSVAQSELGSDEQVIAIRINNAARAYPIRSMSYHHIVNDTLGGRAVVATY